MAAGDTLTPECVGKICEESCERMQLVADILLLQDGNAPTGDSKGGQRLSVLEPVPGGNESYGKLRDAIIAGTKALVIFTREFGHQINSRSLKSIKALSEKITTCAIGLTEDAACAAYYSALTDVNCKPAKPGILHRYPFERAKQDLHLSYNKFKPDYGCPLSSQNLLEVSKIFADNLALLTQICSQASMNESIGTIDRAQFAACSQSLQSTTGMFLAALKAFASSFTEDNNQRCLLFGRPLLAVVDSVVEFSSYPQFGGKQAVLTPKGEETQINILGGAMAIISSCIQLMDTAKLVLTGNAHDRKGMGSQLQKLSNCMKAVCDSAKLLSTSIREHTPLPSRRPSADFT